MATTAGKGDCKAVYQVTLENVTAALRKGWLYTLLLGTVSHGVDAKGRVFIPAKWREELGSTVILSHGILGRDDIHCLFGMSCDSFQAFVSRFSQLPETEVFLQEFRRLLLQNSAECEMDKQGRILIPQPLRDYAGLDKEVKLVGMDNRIEIWDERGLEIHNRDIARNYSTALQQLAARGI